MSFNIYFDEDMSGRLATALRKRGMDVLIASETGNLGISDEEQLRYATYHGRVIITANKRDFIILHKQSAINHAGIILANHEPIGTLLISILKLHSKVSQEDFMNRLEFLSNWR